MALLTSMMEFFTIHIIIDDYSFTANGDIIGIVVKIIVPWPDAPCIPVEMLT